MGLSHLPVQPWVVETISSEEDLFPSNLQCCRQHYSRTKGNPAGKGAVGEKAALLTLDLG